MIPETVLAKSVLKWLESIGWDAYQEVQIQRYGKVADIIATSGNLVWVIECKRALSLNVMQQAYDWLNYANFVSVAVFDSKRQSGRTFAVKVLRIFKMGLLTVRQASSSNSSNVLEVLSPSLNRKGLTTRIKEKLTSAHKTFAMAGNSESLHWTPFKQTGLNVLREVTKKPGITLSELMAVVDHHYGTPVTARSCITHWVQNGSIKGVCAKKDGRIIRLYPKQKEKGV